MWEEFRLDNLVPGSASLVCGKSLRLDNLIPGYESRVPGKNLGLTIFYLDLNPCSVGRI
jgi:hypothetical protein